jgi:hypothetical protein
VLTTPQYLINSKNNNSMAAIASWINEELQHQEAMMTIDDSFIEVLREEGVLELYMPKKVYDSFDFIDYIVEQIIPTAYVVAYDADLPTEDFGTIQKISGELFKVGLQHQFDEKRQIQLVKAIKLARAQNTAVQDIQTSWGEIIKGSNEGLARYIFGTVGTVTQGLVRRLKAISWQAVQYGVVDYTDPMTKSKLQLDYRDPNATYGYAPYGKLAHFPPALAGGDRWDQYATANGLRDIKNWCRQYKDDTGRPPDGVAISEDGWEHLKLQDSTRKALAAIYNTTAGTAVENTGIVGDEMLGVLVRRLQLPVVHLVEEKYLERDLTTKQRKEVRYSAENRLTFLCKGMGEMAIGPTVENDMAAGPHVVARELTYSPPRDAIQGVMTGLPVIPNPKLLFSVEVY